MQAEPAASGGVAFLSVGQSGELPSAHLNAMHVRFKSAVGWPLPILFAGAIQLLAVNIWRSKDVKVFAATSTIL